MDDLELAHFRPDIWTKTLTALVNRHRPEIFIASATSTGRTVMPVLYVDLGTGLTADCTESPIDKQRNGFCSRHGLAIGGNVMADIKTPFCRPQMCTVRPRSKTLFALDPARTEKSSLNPSPPESLSSMIKRLEFLPEKNVGAPLQDAEIIVGRGKGNEKSCQLCPF